MRAGRALRAAVVAATLATLAFTAPARVRADERVTGTVLVREAGDKILMHHDATRAMPAMTMEFALPAGTSLTAGDRIEAAADTSHDPWLLSHVRITAGPASVVPAGHAVPPLQPGDAVPDEAFTDERGRPFALRDLRGHPFVLTFVYTRCRDAHMCPLVSAKLANVQRRTPPSDRLVEVTLDPEHDRPATLAAYARLFGDDPARFRLVCASPIATARFASRFGILARRTDAATIVHSERLALVDGGGRIRALVDDALWDPAVIARKLGDLR